MRATERGGRGLIPAEEPTSSPESLTTEDLLKGPPHLLAAEGIDERIDHRIAHDEYKVHVEVRHKARAIDVLRAGDH